MKILLTLTGILATIFSQTAPLSAASSTDIKLKVLPLNCIFEIINDGSNEIRYLTPVDCGEIINLPDPDNQRGSITNSGIGQTPISNDPPIFRVINPVPSRQETDIYLNHIPEYTSENGASLDLILNQIVYFEVQGNKHSVTIKEIGQNYVVLTIASTPFDTKLFVGETEQHDIDGDDHKDIGILLNRVARGVANITFRQLSEGSGEAISSPPISNEPDRSMFYVASSILFFTLIISVLRHRSLSSKFSK